MLDFILNPQFLALLGIMGAGFAGIGKSAQWYIERLDKQTQARMQLEQERQKAVHDEQIALRDQIQKGFEDRVRFLEVELGIQRQLVQQLNTERQLFLRRIYQLEAYIQYSKLDVPILEGWPPKE
jgi:hypothetical protein